jgi:hypothetical protein
MPAKAPASTILTDSEADFVWGVSVAMNARPIKDHSKYPASVSQALPGDTAKIFDLIEVRISGEHR